MNVRDTDVNWSGGIAHGQHELPLESWLEKCINESNKIAHINIAFLDTSRLELMEPKKVFLGLCCVAVAWPAGFPLSFGLVPPPLWIGSPWMLKNKLSFNRFSSV